MSVTTEEMDGAALIAATLRDFSSRLSAVSWELDEAERAIRVQNSKRLSVTDYQHQRLETARLAAHRLIHDHHLDVSTLYMKGTA